MKFNKWINIGIFSISAAIGGGITAVAITAGLAFSKPPAIEYPYNKLVTDFSKSNNAVDKNVLSQYENMSFSFTYDNDNSKTTSFGTAWYWGSGVNSANKDVAYYATNLHVVKNILVYDASLSSDYSTQFRFQFDIPFYYAKHNEPSVRTRLQDVKLKKLNLEKQIPGLDSKSKPLYSDLAIFETTTKLPNVKKLNFIDEPYELKNVMDNIGTNTYYIAGFPYSDQLNRPVWTTGKYKWNEGTKYNQNEIGWSTAWAMFKPETYRNSIATSDDESSLGLFIKGTPMQIHLSYARQIILPGLNLSGGSSGSLVSIWNATTNELQPLGIYWGVYVGETSDKELVYYGGVDLFYSYSYELYDDPNGSPTFSYNNTF